MSLLALAGWFIIGALAVGAIATFWDDVKSWLNNTAANAVESVLGYGARQKMHRAVSKVDRLVNIVRNRSTVYTKEDTNSTHMYKTQIEATISSYEISDDVLKEIANKGEIVGEFEYRQ